MKGKIPGVNAGCALILAASLSASASASARDPADTMSCESILLAATASAASETEFPRSKVLDQLTGTWDVAYEFVAKDGTVKHNRGQVRYCWILDGKALQETWTSDLPGPDFRPYGTTINFYDPKQNQWTAVWVYPAQGMTSVVRGGDVDGSHVLTGKDESGALQRWSTSVVQPDTVVGRFEVSSDDGRTWKQVGVNHMRRHVGPATR